MTTYNTIKVNGEELDRASFIKGALYTIEELNRLCQANPNSIILREARNSLANTILKM